MEGLKHRPVVPHHSEGVGYFADHFLLILFGKRHLEAGDLSLGDPGVAGHVSSSSGGLGMETRLRSICDSTADIVVAVGLTLTALYSPSTYSLVRSSDSDQE